MHRRLHIAFYTYYYWPEIGAPQPRLTYNARYLARRGHRVTVLTTVPNYPSGIVPRPYRGRLLQTERHEGCDILRAWSFTSPDRRFMNRLKSFLTVQATSSLVGFPRLAEPDVVLVECPPLLNGLMAVVWRRLKRTATVLHISDLEVRNILEFGVLPGPAERPLRAFQRGVMNAADHVVTVTDYCKEALVEEGAPADRLTVIPNGVDVDLFRPVDEARPLRRRLGLPLDRTVAVYAGTHGYFHGVEQIVEAARRLQDEPITIVMIGAGVGKAEAVRRAAACGLTNVRFLPPQPLEDLPAWLNAADIGLSTLVDQEVAHSAIPVKMLSYMACGLPIVSSDRRHARQMLEESGGAGVLVPAGDAGALAGAIREMAALDADARRRMGRLGREYVVAGWSRRRQAERLLDVLHQAVARRAAMG